MNAAKPLVYVVDDEEVIAITLALILNQAGFIALPFTDANDVLAAARAGAVPDFLISDVVMPEMSGVELAIQFEQSYPACKVLLFSGEVIISRHLEDAWQQGYKFEVLPKPVHPADLLARLHNDFPHDCDNRKAVDEPAKVAQ